MDWFTNEILGHDRFAQLPWKVIDTSAYDRMPTFAMGEVLFFSLTVLALLHALSCKGAERDKHLLLWLISTVGGLANDVIFMLLPVVDNFWHAQGLVMLNPRLPLYILCLYLCFLYFPNAIAWRLGLSPLPQACVSAILASAFYSPFDILGIKFLWWTWHDTDNTTLHRLVGVPIASTTWLITFNFCFAYVLRKTFPSVVTVAGGLWSLVLTCAISVPMMMTIMALVACAVGFQDVRPFVSGEPWGPPANNVAMYIVTTALIVLGAVRGLWTEKRQLASGNAPTQYLWAAVVLYFSVLAKLMVSGDPTKHISTGTHQVYGPCGVEAIDYTGSSRHKYICKKDFEEDFTFNCPAGPAENLTANPVREGYDETDTKWQWYTVCGKPKDDGWLSKALGVCGFCSIVYIYFLTAAILPPEPHRAVRGGQTISREKDD